MCIQISQSFVAHLFLPYESFSDGPDNITGIIPTVIQLFSSERHMSVITTIIDAHLKY